MNKLIFYPTFEVLDGAWLKFALLYLGKLCPIIPMRARNELSKEFLEIENETDLIQPLPIDKSEGSIASNEAINQLIAIFNNPKIYSGIFGNSFYLDKWRSKEEQNFLIFEDKYTHNWEQFVISSKLGYQEPRGVIVSNEVAHIYLTILAHVLGDAYQLSPITDQPKLDNYAVFAKRPPKPNAKSAIIAKRIINISLPKDLNSINLKKIIRFRSRKDFKDMIESFHKSVEDALKNDKGDDPIISFFDNNTSIMNGIKEQIGSLSSGTVLLGICIWNLIENKTLNPAGIAEKLISAGAAFSYYRKAWSHIKPKFYTKKYLACLYQEFPNFK